MVGMRVRQGMFSDKMRNDDLGFMTSRAAEIKRKKATKGIRDREAGKLRSGSNGQALYVRRKTFLAIWPSGVQRVSRDLVSRERTWGHGSTELLKAGDQMFSD